MNWTIGATGSTRSNLPRSCRKILRAWLQTADCLASHQKPQPTYHVHQYPSFTAINQPAPMAYPIKLNMVQRHCKPAAGGRFDARMRCVPFVAIHNGCRQTEQHKAPAQLRPTTIGISWRSLDLSLNPLDREHPASGQASARVTHTPPRTNVFARHPAAPCAMPPLLSSHSIIIGQYLAVIAYVQTATNTYCQFSPLTRTRCGGLHLGAKTTRVPTQLACA